MFSRCFWIVLVLLVGIAAEGRATGIFKRTPKPEPAEHVPALIKTLKTDADDRKRLSAAEELREYDPKLFPDIISALIEALHNDSSVSVRLEAANTIGRLRPITQPAGYALEQAAQNDPAIRVRLAAKSSLVHWTILGYKQGRAPEALPNQTGEPPLAEPLPASKSGSSAKPTSPPPASTPVEKDNPPRLSPPLMTTPSATKTPPRSFFPLFPAKNTKPDAKSGTKPSEEGPALGLPM